MSASTSASWLVAAALLSIVPASPSAATPHVAAAATLAPSGPHAVGRRFETWRDEARPDPTDATRRREVAITIWYPASGASTPSGEPALPGPWGNARLARLEKKLGAATVDAMRAFRVHARTDAPMLSGTTRWPVVLFTPGLGWLATDYAVFTEDLASHGFIVIGISPVGFADVVQLPDGRMVERTLGIGAAIGVDQAHVHEDARFVLGRLRALDTDPDSPFRGRVDLTRLAAFGHSLGGTTAHVLVATEPLVRAGVNIDGDPMGSVLDVRPTRPLLLISSESPSMEEAPPFPSEEHRTRVREGLERSERRRTDDWHRMSAASSSARRIRIQGTRHLNFEDAAAFVRFVTPAERWMKVGPIDGARGLVVTRDLVRAFFAHTLAEADDTLLRAPERQFPEARLEVGSAR